MRILQFFPSRGQATVEYLIILAIGLTIALIGIGLYGFFPDVSQDLQNNQLQIYWREQARPFLVEDAIYDKTNQRFYVALRSLANEEFNITGIYLNNTQLSFFKYNSYALPDFLGQSLCPELSCADVSNCPCSAPIRPSTEFSVVSEKFSNQNVLCGASGSGGRLNISLIYNRPNDISVNFTQTSPVPLFFVCK